MATPRRTAKGPLRLVVDDFWQEEKFETFTLRRHVERLECGHIIRVRTDIYGEFYSARRRCGECKKEMEQKKGDS